MKKIIFTITLLTTSMSVFSIGVFNVQIPQPDFISNDWDGDGKSNAIDEDDDGDGILDINDDIPFGQPDGNSGVLSGITSFTANKSEIFIGETISFSWNIEGNSNLSLFGGTFNQLSGLDVTGINSESDVPIESSTYTLYSNSGSKSVDVSVLPHPIVNSFDLNGYSSNIQVASGDDVNISWDISGGRNISVTGGNLSGQNNLTDIGSIIDNPIVDTTYTLFDGLNSIELDVVMISNDIDILTEKHLLNSINVYYYDGSNHVGLDYAAKTHFLNNTAIATTNSGGYQGNNSRIVSLVFNGNVKPKSFSYTGTAPNICTGSLFSPTCISINDLNAGNAHYDSSWMIMQNGTGSVAVTDFIFEQQ